MTPKHGHGFAPTRRAFGKGLMALPVGAGLGGRARAAALTDLRLSVTPAVNGGIELRAGIEKGIFEKHGLRLVLNHLPTGPENITAIVGRSADIAYGDTFAGLSAIQNGFDIKLIAPNNYTTKNVFYLVHDDSDIKEPSDLANRTLGLGVVPFLTVFAKAFLAHNGVDPASVKLSLIRNLFSIGEALVGRRVDAIQSVNSVPVYQLRAQYGFRVVGNPDTSAFQNPRATQAAFWATSEWLARNGHLAEKFALAVRETNAWYLGLPPEQRAVEIKKHTTVDLLELEKRIPGVLGPASISNAVPEPIDIPATLSWIDIGNRYANVPKLADFEARVFRSAL